MNEKMWQLRWMRAWRGCLNLFFLICIANHSNMNKFITFVLDVYFVNLVFAFHL